MNKESSIGGVRIGDRVRELRLKRDWSQGELGKRSRVAEQTISNIETGRHVPDTETLLKISRGFDVGLGTLLEASPGTSDTQDDRVAAEASANGGAPHRGRASRIRRREDRDRVSRRYKFRRDRLSERERFVIEAYYALEGDTAPATYAEIGDRLGISREYVRRLRRAAEEKLFG